MDLSAIVSAALAYCAAHPQAVLYVLGGLLSLLAHAFAKRSPRVAAALQALVLDLPKLYGALTGKEAPPPTPPALGAYRSPYLAQTGEDVDDEPTQPTVAPTAAARVLGWGRGLVLACAVAGTTLAIACGASPSTVKTVVGDALSVEQIACVIANAELGKGEPTAIAAVCSIPPELITQVTNQIVGAERGDALAAAARADAGAK